MPDSEEIRGWIKDLVHALDTADWDGEATGVDPAMDKTRSRRRIFDAISLAHMKFSDFFGERERAERINQALFRISNAVNTARGLAELYASIHHALAANIDTTNFYIALHNKEDDTLSFPYFIDEITYTPVSIVKKITIKDPISLTSNVIRTGKPIFLTKKDQVKFYKEAGGKPYGPLAEVWLGVPLTVRNDVIGAMVVQSYTDPDLYGEADVDILVSISEQIAIAIQRKKDEEALQVEKAHIERLFEGVQEAIVISDAANAVLNINPEFTRMFGYSKPEVVGRTLDELIVPGEFMEEALACHRRIRDGEKVAFESSRRGRDGARIHTSVIAAPILVKPDEYGQYTIYRDITDQKRADGALLALYHISRAVNSTKDLDELYRLIHESLGAVMDARNFYIALYDEKEDALTFPYYIDERDDAEPVFEASKTNSLTTKVIFKNKTHLFNEAQLRRMSESNGDEVLGVVSKVWLGVPLSIKGKAIGALAVQSHTDPDLFTEKDIAVLESVSEQIAIAIDCKRTEEALFESEKRYRTLFDNAGDAIFFHDMGRVFLDVNAVACEQYGYSRKDFLKMSPRDLVLPEQRYQVPLRIRKIREAGQLISEVVHMRRDGAKIPFELNSRFIEYNGKPVVLSIARNITDRKTAEKENKRLETQLQNARKMEAIGMLAGGVAHDLNNILGGLVSYPELLLLDLPGKSPMRDGILLIQRSGSRAAAIVQDLLTLARRGVVVSDVVDLNRIVTDHLESPEHTIPLSRRPGVRVATDLDPGLFNIMGSSVHLTRTLMNLISNAAEAMPEGGDIAISTRNRYLDKPVKGYDDIRPGDYVTLTVSDSGTGILPVDMERIFEPFYTRKVMGRSGTGLGMAVVWGTVKDHDGYIDIRTEEGRGSAFTLYFPITRKASAA